MALQLQRSIYLALHVLVTEQEVGMVFDERFVEEAKPPQQSRRQSLQKPESDVSRH